MTCPALLLLSFTSPSSVAVVSQELEDHEDEGQEPEDGEGVIAASLPRAALVTGLQGEQLLDQATLSQRQGQTEVSRAQPFLSLLDKSVTDADILHLNNFSFH